MRVVHIIKAKGIAGAERHLLDLMAGLRERSVDAMMILLAEPNNTADSMQAAAEALNIPVQRIVIKRHLDFSLFSRLCDALQALHPDIVHTHLLHADLYGTIAARWVRCSMIISSRHNDDPRNRRFPLRQLQFVLWRLNTAGIAISEAVKRHNVNVEGAPAAKINVIHYGLPLPVAKIDKPQARQSLRSELNLKPDTPLLGMVCRLMDAKGIPDALNAFARMMPEFPNVHFIIAGEGPLRASLEAQTRSLKLTERVHFLGWREHPMQIIAALDILLMPSVREGFGMTLLEAMAQAIPIIGSTASAIPEVIAHEQTGLTVPPRDPITLAEAIKTLLRDKPLRMHMGLLGEERLETHFSAARMIEQTSNLYHTLLNSKK